MKFLSRFRRQPPSLSDIVERHEGKIFDKWRCYIDTYETEFARYRDMQDDLIEIGVQNCGSVEVWAKYFPKLRQITGVDIVEKLNDVTFDDPRIGLIICDSNKLIEDKRLAHCRPRIIIDDASHQSRDIIKAFVDLFPMLLDDGLYVIEDLCCSYWDAFNVDAPQRAMDFFKMLVDTINAEHWQEGQYTPELESALAPFVDLDHYDYRAELGKIRSIKFVNSMCFIEKCTAGGRSTIGRRVISGRHAPLGFQASDDQQIDDVKARFQ